MKGCAWLAALLLSLSAMPGAQARDTPASEDITTWPLDRMEIRTAQGVEHFKVRIADNPARQEQGLMFVRKLPHDAGMLFPQTPPAVLSMWMKNTLIPLDMLFVAADGHIAHIHANATPESLAIISYPLPVASVLELPGGECARRGIREGDVLARTLPN
ncbi:MAG: DUF192 domain-containing protein [Steroidobacteraceae bacterium]